MAYRNYNEKIKTNKIIMTILIIIIIILMITSCTSLFWGKIGNPFNNSTELEIDDDKHLKESRNNELQFIAPIGETYIGSIYRIEFTLDKIDAKEFTCTPSDADIAVCIVKGNYVEVYAIKEGNVTISIITETNNKKYIGTHELTIKDESKPVSEGVVFTRTKNTIYLNENNTLKIPYKLINIAGDLSVTSSDSSIATVELINNEVIVKAFKEGNVKITLTVTKDGKEYQTSCIIAIKKERPSGTENNNANNYYYNIATNKYELAYTSKDNRKNLILETNLFNEGKINVQNILGGIRLSNNLGYIDITSSNPNILEIGYNLKDNEKIKNYISYLVTTKNSGNASITISGSDNNNPFPTRTINVNITAKYYVTLNAQDGVFANNLKEYSFLLSNTEELDLSKYIAYKEADKQNCLYYTLDSFNTMPNGLGTKYSKDSKFIATSDTTLYAVYSSTSTKEEITKTGTAYLTDVDIFHNEEYFNKYGKDKVIYPGASGSYIITIENTLDKEVKINKINLEEKTICQDNLGCLNMGYIIKYSHPQDNNYTYYYGSSNKYQTFNEDANIININESRRERNIDFGISLKPKEKIEVSLLWKWLDNDELDTAIGSLGNNNQYDLLVSLDYEIKESVCK